MTDQRYWHRHAVDQLFKARQQLAHARDERDSLQTTVDALRAATRDLVADLDTMRDRAEQAEARASEEETRAETWEENHRILAEHFQRMTTRVETAEHQWDYWMDRASEAEHVGATEHWRDAVDSERARAEAAEADRNLWFARAQAPQRNCRSDDCDGCNEAELERYAAEQRAAAWWEAAKNLCRRRNRSVQTVVGLSRLLVNEWNSKGYIL